MELLIVMLAVGASAIYLARRFWKSLANSVETECSEGCAGCSCTSGDGNHLETNGNSCLEDCQERSRDGGRGYLTPGR